MPKHIQTEVLVVGAGPVGLTAANLLADCGVRVTVIDKEQGPTTRSYACALHPRSLEMVERLGLLDEVLRSGHRVDTLALYDRKNRRGEARFSALSARHPYVVVLPQFALENLLAQRLARAGAAQVHWSHRLSDLRLGGDRVTALVDKLGETALGYSFADWDTCVEANIEATAGFVIGADGRHSGVRRVLGIDDETFGSSETFGVYEFEISGYAGREVRVLLDSATATTDVFWPLSETRGRWSFGREKSASPREFPPKERTRWRVPDPETDTTIQREFEGLIHTRAPWFEPRIAAVEWTTEVRFEPCLAREFGRGRCWLAGDAAHQTGPAGMQSMNLGLLEADDLATRLAAILQKGTPVNSLDDYAASHRMQWQQLLRGDGLEARADTDPWIRARGLSILSCIPASGPDLTALLAQQGLTVSS